MVAGGVHPPGQRAHVVDTGRIRQKSKHETSLPTGAPPQPRP